MRAPVNHVALHLQTDHAEGLRRRLERQRAVLTHDGADHVEGHDQVLALVADPGDAVPARLLDELDADDTVAAALARLGDIYVDDAFSVAHRAHASVEAIAHLLPAYAGRAMQAELKALEKALHAPARPVAAIVGGAKISTKLDLLGNLLKHVDTLIIGGGMANTFLAAQGKAIEAPAAQGGY